ncbi:MAG: class I SAM-dependent methyltransferase, partial [Dissulfurimicrobium sp.]
MLRTGDEKRRFVREKFASVAGSYDILNSILSMKIDSYWRFITARELKGCEKGPILDLCAGTLPLSREIAKRRDNVVAMDFCYEMLRCGTIKLKGDKKTDFIMPVCGDGEELPLSDARFSGITVAFGVRNLSRIEKGLGEMRRVLKPGGKLIILEFSRPKNPAFSK